MKKKYSLVGLAGTFGPLHIAHKQLFRKAFEISEKVMIGITDDSMVKNKPLSELILPYSKRKEAIIKFLEEEGYLKNVIFIKLNDPYGPAIEDSGLEALVVSDETSYMEKKINDIRKKRNLKPLDFVSLKLILAKDGKRISSTRIRKKEIDVYGNVLK
ncbi:MAG: phosphopantetheine adenylyltransferase [Candidatus Helarchaeota archaeon]